MSIWEYNHENADKDLVERASVSKKCLFCKEPLQLLTEQIKGLEADDYFRAAYDQREVYTCPTCGWWNVRRTVMLAGSTHGSSGSYGAAGTLRPLDLTNIETPVDAIRSYLVARFEKRFEVGPQIFEETVASVFRDIGFSARVTGYSNDGGIDIILDGPSGVVVGVQVKRYRNAIKVEQLRSLTGALVSGGMTLGIFVTTSTFQKGANPLVKRLAQVGYKIELIDAPRFLDALKIAQRSRYAFKNDPTAAYTGAELIYLGTACGTY